MTLGALEIVFPWVLALLPLAYLLHRITRGAALPLNPSARRISLALRIALFVCLVCAMCDPRLWMASQEKHVVWAIDVSASVGSSATNEALAFAREAGLPEATQSWMAFAREAQALPSRPDAEVEPPGGSDATNLSRAVQMATATFPAGRSRVLVLFSDGVETVGDVAAEIEGLRRAGVTVFTVPVPPLDQPEVLVAGLDAPRSVRVNEPFEIRARLASNRETTARIDVFLDGLLAGSRDLQLSPGDTSVAITQRLSAGRAAEIAVVVSADQDTRAENNSASVIVMAEGKAPVLLITEAPSPELALALEPQGISVETRPAIGLPQDPAALQGFDAVILDRVEATRVSADQMRALERYVRDFGGGLLMLGGPEAFGAGGWSDTPVGRILPVVSEFEKQVEVPSLALVPVVDRSGSMTGEKMQMAKAAAIAAVEILAPRDYAGVVVFDNEAGWAPQISSAAEAEEIIRKIGAIEAGGGTNIAAGLELALQGLRVTPAKLKHVILLTDGISVPGPFDEIVGQMVAEGMTLTCVAVGTDSDEALLERLARAGGGRYYYTDSADSIPQIFARETMMASRPNTREEPFFPSVVRRAPFLAGIDFAESPMLLGYVMTKLRPGADFWLATESGDPLLATWRVGLGKTAAFTSDARSVWGSEWLRWQSFGTFWAQTLREVMRPSDLRAVPVRLERDDRGFRVVVDTVDALGRPLPRAEGTITVSPPDGQQPREVPLRQIGPGIFEAPWETSQPGTHHVIVALRTTTGDFSEYLGVVEGYPPEYLMEPVNEPLLRSLASETTGQFNPTPADVRNAIPTPQASSLELWPWFAWLALALFLADVGVRKRASRKAS